MTEAVTSALVSTILGNLNTLVHEELGLVFGIQTEFEKLKRTFMKVQAVLKDAEEKQWKDEAIRIWLTDLKDAAYDADDVLDEFAIEAQRRRQRGGLKNQVRSLFSLHQNPLVFRLKMAHKVKNVSEKLDAIANEKNKFRLTEGVGENEADSFDWRITSSLVNESEIYGRDKEKEELISLLLANSDDLSVCADLVKVQSLRSLITIQESLFPSGISGALLFKVSSQKKLRTLNLSCFTFEKLPEPIGNLQHLRYLDVSNSLIQKLPESISSLQNLQTLNLSNCSRLYMLPKRMKDMKSLMYLDLTGCDALQCMPSGMGQLTCLRKLGMFIVGKEAGHHIGELQRLNYIGGELSIKDLGNVQGFTDAQNAYLTRKTNLQSLSLSWREDNNSKISEANSEDVLCALEPHSNMKKLEISGYQGSKFPYWMMELRLPNLVEISLESCMNCEHLPPFGKLQFLKSLQLQKMDAVKCIGSELYGDGENPFPSLQRLTFGEMMNLEEWETNTKGGSEILTCLHELQIRNCPKLVELPVIPSVKELTIEDCSVTLLRSVVNFTSITSLQIERFDELTVLPDGLLQNHTCLQSLLFGGMRSLRSLSNQLNNLSSLKSLRFMFCDKLESLPEGVQNLNSLEALFIGGVPKITTLPGLPSSLDSLFILECQELTSISEGLQHLTALNDFHIAGCPKLNSLPESIQHLTSLRYLAIFSCDGLSSLPNQIRHVTSLSRLRIGYCSNLMSLPEGIRNLEMLRELEIAGCPNLERRCKREKGKDWPNIAHIPTIIINDQLIQSLET
uniref:Uncharacterized protein n=1 Tax=Populus alba TaxID=43335 RepID=A0A4V6A414_POPAL|nr:hypothetical protein D5086_0000249730 [Populus alba]